jgi:hypothetical protein
MSAIKALAKIQRELHAPKGQVNKFGGYSYRSCEDILQAVKPLLGDSVILVSDEIKVVGDRIYVQATAKFCYEDQVIENVAYAREPLNKKGMDESQITGAASSYARKYALNGLLLIDDNKDADSMDNSQQSEKPHPSSREAKEAKKLRQQQNDLYQVISGYLADESQHDFAREALLEITDEDEKRTLWGLMTSKEKEIIRTLKVM